MKGTNMSDSIFLNIYFDIVNYSEEYEEKIRQELKETFLNKWLRIYIHNCDQSDKKILDIIYEYANMYGTKITLIINENTSILSSIEDNYTNIDSIIFSKEEDYNKYNNQLRKIGIECRYSNESRETNELSSFLSLEKTIEKRL